MTFDNYFEAYVWNTEVWDSLVDESYWDQSFNTDQVFQLICSQALKDGIVISDLEVIDYDKLLYTAYKSTEKGLS